MRLPPDFERAMVTESAQFIPSSFTSTRVWVLQEDVTRNLVVQRKEPDTNAVSGFLSYFDALLEALFLKNASGLRCMPVPASRFDTQPFRSGNGYAIALHMGFAASQKRLILNRDNQLSRITMTVRWASDHDGLELPAYAVAEFARLYEAAGIFAWREMFCDTDWSQEKLDRVTAQMELPVIPWRKVRADQCALFNSESGQWHFVPLKV